MNISWATPMYLFALYGLIRYALRTNNNNKSHTQIQWDPLESVGITLFIYFFGQLVGSLLLYIPLLLIGWSEEKISRWAQDTTVGQFFFILGIEVITVYLLLSFLKKRNSSFKTIGLNRRPRFNDVGMAIIAYVIYFISLLVVVRLVEIVFPGINVDQKQDIGFDSVVRWQLPLVFISLVVLPPIVEEVLMRGFLYTGLKSKLPRYIAVLITSILFAVAHLQVGNEAPLLWVAAIDTFLLSLFLIYLRERTGTLWASIMLHALKNMIAFLLLFVLVN